MENYKGKKKHSVSELELMIELLIEVNLNSCKELKVTDEIYNQRQKVVDAIDDISECKDHGRNCVPNSLEWIKRVSKNKNYF